MNTTETNKKLAEFLGWKKQFHHFHKGTEIKTIDSFKFHNDYNSLMLVVEKIESLESNLKNETKEEFKQFQKILSLPIYSKIEAVYNACSMFVDWYNNQKP